MGVNQYKGTKRMAGILLASLIICLLVNIVLYFYLGGYSKEDITGHWKICKYTLEGYNPYLYIDQEAPLAEVGVIPKGFSTVPWSCVFGSVFYGGFLSLESACLYIVFLHVLALTILLFVFCKEGKRVLPAKQLVVLMLVPCVHFSFMYSLHFGNAGGVICSLLIISFLITKKHPFLAGILVGLAMMKPQITAIICLVFLLRREWKVLFVAAAVVLLGWGATVVATGTRPLELLVQTFSSGTAETQYLGLMNNLKYFSVDESLVLVINIGLGCVYTLALYQYLRKAGGVSSTSPVVFVPACIASVFSIYKNGTDYMIVAFAALFFCLLCMNREMSVKDYLLSLLSIGYLEMGRCAVYLGISLCQDNLFVRDLFKSADGLVLMIIGVYLCKLWIKYDGEKILTSGDEHVLKL